MPSSKALAQYICMCFGFFLLRNDVCICPCDQSNGAVVDVLSIKALCQ